MGAVLVFKDEFAFQLVQIELQRASEWLAGNFTNVRVVLETRFLVSGMLVYEIELVLNLGYYEGLVELANRFHFLKIFFVQLFRRFSYDIFAQLFNFFGCNFRCAWLFCRLRLWVLLRLNACHFRLRPYG